MKSENYIKIVSFDTRNNLTYGDTYKISDHLQEYMWSMEELHSDGYTHHSELLEYKEFPKSILFGCIDKEGEIIECEDKNPFTTTYGLETYKDGKPYRFIKRTLKHSLNDTKVHLFEYIDTYNISTENVWITDIMNGAPFSLEAIEFYEDSFMTDLTIQQITDDVISISIIRDKDGDRGWEDKFRDILFPDDYEKDQLCQPEEYFLYNTKTHRCMKLCSISYAFDDIEDEKKHAIAVLTHDKYEAEEVVGVYINLETMELTTTKGKPFKIRY